MYYGDFDFGSTVHIKFTTVNSTGAPTALSSAGVTVYRDGSTVQDSSGVTLTSTFDTVTGLNHLQVDMSTAGFYSSAGEYTAIISSGAASEDLSGYVIGQWSIRERYQSFSTAGLETVSTAGLETASSLVDVVRWGGTTVEGMPHDSSLVTSQFSTAGLETASSIVDMHYIAGASTSALTFKQHADAQTTGITLDGSSNTFANTDLTETTPDHYKGLIIKFTSGALNGQGSDITAYSSTGKVTFTSVTDNVSSDITFVIA